MQEEWRDIEEYFGLYQISNLGNVKSLGNNKTRKEKILKPEKTKGEYLRVCLSKDGKHKMYLVHRLVASTFIENPNNYEEINHRDEDKANNYVSNLEWCDRKHNINYGTHNQRSAASRINHPKRSKQVLCVETGKVYKSTHQVQRELGFAQGYISSACIGKYKQAYGYTWKYVS